MSIVGTLTACALLPGPTRPPSPTIEIAGIIAEERIYQDRIEYRLADGRTWEAATGTYRSVMNWGSRLLVAGSDAEGRWIATFGPQGGLPEDCYFTPEHGTEWGDSIAIKGVVFGKDSAFRAGGEVPAIGQDYKSGTRFCFNDHGLVASTIAP